MNVSEIVDVLRPLVDGSLVAVDFDGTLAPLQLDPERSRPVSGTVEALRGLAARGARVAVVTGRDAGTALRLGGFADVPGITVAGVYGVETWHDGNLDTPDTPEAIEQLRVRLPDALRDAAPQVWIEDKRLSLVVHTRQSDEPAGERDRLAPAVTALGEDLGLEVHLGSDVLELRLPGYDKAGALDRLTTGARAVLYLGDDLGDLPAFDHVQRLRAGGVPAYAVAVASSGVEQVIDAADAVVADPDAVVALLTELAG